MDAAVPPREFSFVVPGIPTAWARAGRQGGISFTPKKQVSFMAALRTIAGAKLRGPPLDGPVELSLRATYVHPESWSRRRKAVERWKTSAPDNDNLGKIVGDALQGVAWINDAQIASLHVWKTYGERAELAVVIKELR